MAVTAASARAIACSATAPETYGSPQFSQTSAGTFFTMTVLDPRYSVMVVSAGWVSPFWQITHVIEASAF